MTKRRQRRAGFPAACAALLALASSAAQPAPLSFRIDEGHNVNSFVRDGDVAAHLLLRSGKEPRILVAFPAGNSGVGLWFETTKKAVTWNLTSPPRPFTARDQRGRAMNGIEFAVEIAVPRLEFRGAVLSSVRVLRDYELLRKAPDEVLVEPRATEGFIAWTRDRLDGAAGYQLSIEAEGGTRISPAGISSVANAPLRLKIWALTGETPLTPLPAMLTAAANNDARARNALAFLSYEQKFLAGSWRFDTYFGRDTLISALLLAPVLEPAAMESALSSVLDRLAPNGEVAHEEDIGEFAVLRNLREGRGRADTPVYDYGMVDDDFLLAPLAARWLLDDERGRARARTFLAGSSEGTGRPGATRGELLARNLLWLVQRAAAFAEDPSAGNLVGIHAGRMTGNWRDSEQGLGRGRYAYDVNAALVPAALEAAASIHAQGLLNAWLDASGRQALSQAAPRAKVWAENAPALFEVKIPADAARANIAAYAREAGIDGAAAARALGRTALVFHALSLDAQGKPISILHSDEGFRLLLTRPAAEELETTVSTLMRPFPAGLITDAGLLVANPAHSTPELRREFTRFAYHGTVIWSWQQALMAAGITRQLQRADLPASTRTRLQQAHRELWRVIERTGALRTSELWSWSWSKGRIHAEAFGRPGADADESNAAQLWSTVFLGLAPPRSAD